MLVMLLWSSPALCGEIHSAARDGDLGKVRALLKDAPYLVFSKDNSGYTPLHLAAQMDHKDVAGLLLADKAEVDARAVNGRTPLYVAAIYGHKDVAELLLAHDAEVNAKNKDGGTPLRRRRQWP